jgi:hypothetical protein
MAKKVISRLTAITEQPEEKAKKRKKLDIETPLEKRNKKPTYSDKYEEELIRQLFEEEVKKRLQEKADEEESDYYEDSAQKHTKKKDGIWDVPLDEEIHYFDPELSYELTGYRPLTMEQGLDFDPEPFIVPAKTFLKTGAYTEYPSGTKPFRDY